jgi:hypothetical protein
MGLLRLLNFSFLFSPAPPQLVEVVEGRKKGGKSFRGYLFYETK